MIEMIETNLNVQGYLQPDRGILSETEEGLQLSLLLGETQERRARHGASQMLDEAGRVDGEGETGEGVHLSPCRGPQSHASLHLQPRGHGEGH